MTTITYCKGLPTNVDELTPIGYSEFELFLGAFSEIFHAATIETVNLLLNLENKFNQSSWNTHLQKVYGISRRHAHGVIANAKGRVNSTKECRTIHIKQLKSKLNLLLIRSTKARANLSWLGSFMQRKIGYILKQVATFLYRHLCKTKKPTGIAYASIFITKSDIYSSFKTG